MAVPELPLRGAISKWQIGDFSIQPLQQITGTHKQPYVAPASPSRQLVRATPGRSRSAWEPLRGSPEIGLAMLDLR